jgi:hypothetical protein
MMKRYALLAATAVLALAGAAQAQDRLQAGARSRP